MLLWLQRALLPRIHPKSRLRASGIDLAVVTSEELVFQTNVPRRVRDLGLGQPASGYDHASHTATQGWQEALVS